MLQMVILNEALRLKMLLLWILITLPFPIYIIVILSMGKRISSPSIIVINRMQYLPLGA